MNNKKDFFSTVFCIFIAVLFLFGCNNHLLKLQQDEAHLIVKITNSTGARNASTTGDWQISAWIENQDGSESHHQNLNSASGEETSLTFDDLVIGSQIKIHLELTKNDDTQTKLTGTSGWKTIEEGVNVIIIVLTEDHGAQVPVIKEINSTIETYTSNPKPVTATLKADASVTDGGNLTYQWYSSDSPTTDSGTAIEGATNATYEAKVDAGKTKYFYCVVTNTNSTVNGNKTASATSNIATVASIVGQLDRITAQYIGSTYELVNSEIKYSNIEIVQVYAIPDAEPQEISVFASSVQNQYTIELQDNNGIGNVPATVTHITETQITADFTIPVKYQLDANNLTISGDSSVEQNEELKLTAEYKVDGKDSYNLYTSASSSGSYKIIENVTISWTGATKQPNAWEALAETNSAGTGKIATVTLTPKDEWCVTTSGVEKSHSYEVTAATTAGGITDENSLLEAINQAQDGDSITIPNEITITNTITVNKNIIIDGNKTGTLFRSNKGTITGPMFEVSNSGNLTLQNITLDGQYNNDFYGGENNPFIINNGGTLTVSSSTLTDNRMSPTGAYGSIPQLYASAAIYSAGTTVITKSEISDVSSNTNQRGIVYGVSGSLTIIDTNITLPTSYNGNALYLESGVSYNINNKTSDLSQSYKSITPDSP